MRLLATAVALLLAASPAAAQWMPAGPTNATPVAFAVNARAVFAADFSLRTIHRSTDDGRTWQNASPTVTNAGNTPRLTGLAAHDGAVGATVRASNGSGTGFYRSTNDGATWTRVATMPTTQNDYEGLIATRSGAFAAVAVAPSTYQRRLMVSTDAGATWTLRDSVFLGGQRVLAIGDTLVRTYSRTKRMYPGGPFVTDRGVAISKDLGVSWTEHPTTYTGTLGQQQVASTGNPFPVGYGAGTLYAYGFASTDLGQTWNPIPSFNGSLFTYVGQGTRLLAASSASGERFGFFVDPDGTGPAPWQNASDPAQVDEALPQAFFSTGTAFLVGLERGGVLRSEDGITWTPAGRFAAHHNSDIAALTTHRDSLVASWVNIRRFVRSGDGGATWRNDHDRMPSLDNAAGFLSLDSVLLAGGLEGVYRSTNSRDWTRISAGLRNVDGFVVVNGRVLAGATGGLYERPASGTTWTQVLNHNLNQFDAGVSGSRVIVNGGNGSQRSYRISLDGGTTWGPGGPSGGSFQVAATSRAFVTAATGIAIFGGGSFQRSLDDGATWHNLKPALGDSLAPNLLDNRGDTLIAIGATYLAASVDHGTTWRRVPHTGLGFTFSSGSATNAPLALTRMGDTLYVAFAGNGVWKRSLNDLGLTVATERTDAPAALGLAVAPSPARGSAAVAVTLGAPGPVRVAVVDALGRTVAVLHDGDLGSGTHRFDWGETAAPGVYLVHAATPTGTLTRSLVRLR